MDQVYDRSTLEGALSLMESAAFNFSTRFINDGKVRMSYINQTRKLAQEYRTKVASGTVSLEEAAKQVQAIRNQILEAQRLRTSDVGKAITIKLKKTGLTCAGLTEKYAQSKFGTSFLKLSAANQKYIFLEIIDSSGRPGPSMNTAANRFSKLGRGLLVVTVDVAVYNIAVADDKTKATAREGIIIGGALGADFTFGWLF